MTQMAMRQMTLDAPYEFSLLAIIVIANRVRELRLNNAKYE
jgi:hypothetical protein